MEDVRQPVQGAQYSTEEVGRLRQAVVRSYCSNEGSDRARMKEWEQLLELFPIALGDCLLEDLAGTEDLLILCEGRVRVLSYSAAEQRQLSVQVLEQGAVFGNTSWVNASEIEPLPYRVVASSAGWVARLPGRQRQAWIEQFPAFQEQWLAQEQVREQLVFLKAYASMGGAVPTGEQLQQLQAYITPVEIAAGEQLAAAAAHSLALDGLLWVRSGCLSSTDEPDVLLEVGQTFRLSTKAGQSSQAKTWTAQTAVRAYGLKQQHWSELRQLQPELMTKILGPELETSAGEQVLGGRRSPRLNAKSIVGKRSRPQRKVSTPSSRRTLKSDASASPQRPTGPDVEFPQPPRRSHLKAQLRLWGRYPFIAQQSAADCGPTCLAMLGQFWGHRLNLNLLRGFAKVGRSGASLKHLAAAAEQAGFSARPVRASLSKMQEQRLPWIAHWQGEHYVVVYAVKGEHVLLSDPGRGRQKLPRQQFLESWTGYALMVAPTERLKQSGASQRASLGQFWKVLWPYRSILGQIVVLSLLMQLFGMVSPIFTQVILDQVVVQKSLTTLNVFVIGALLFGVWQLSLGAVRQYLLDYFSNRLNLTLVSGFVNHALRLPLSFFENRQVGDILTRVGENQKIQAFLMRQAISTWLDALMAVVYLGLMFYYNSQLSLLVVGMLPPIILLTLVATPFLKKLSREVFNDSAEQSSLLVEMLTGVATVKAAAAEQEVRWRWEDRFTRLLNTQFRAQKLTNMLSVLSSLINTIGSMALLWYGSRLVIQDQLSIGQLVAFNMLIGRVIGPVLSLVGLWDEFQEVLIAVERLNDVLEEKPESGSGALELVLPTIQGDVEFDGVTFRYEQMEERNILESLSFVAKAGETIAIVGRSGSGKTTMVKLLQGLYPTTSGRIWIDGHDLGHTSLRSLRSQLGVVPQECFLFSGTIMENIQLYRTEFGLEAVVEAAKLAEAHAFIQDLPLGYNTKVGERGANLSGGQRQRIAIARALLGNPRILLLDEATSSLDTESERRFQQNLTRISQGRTTFIIAHRLSTVRNADCILVLDSGVLVEKGSHKQLVEQRGLYYHLAQQQLEL